MVYQEEKGDVVRGLFEATALGLNIRDEFLKGNSKVFLDDLVEQSGADLFTCVMRNCRPSSIGVFIDYMTSPCMVMDEAESLDDLSKLLSCKPGEFGQTYTSSCCMPMNSMVTSPLPPLFVYPSIASRVRSRSWLSERACV